MFWLLWLTGCAPKVLPADVAERFRVRLSADFSVGELVGLPEDAALLLGGVGVEMDLVVEKTLARTFRDASQGHRLQFLSASATMTRGDAAAEAIELTLAGRSVELRTFPDGELLDVDLIEHVVGPGRLLDVFDVVFPAITPAPPERLSGQRAVHWPVRLSRQQQLLSSAWVSWVMLERDRVTAHVQYDGPWESRGRAGALRMSGEGTVRGDVWLGRRDRRLERHTLSWERTLTVTSEAGVKLDQVQRFSGEVERL
ncbi:MAG: hypothetical protein ACI8S6_005747 [Myxococcota bacterium]|jgi:hypothetical protein